MKNVHVLPTDKPSKLYIGDNQNFVFGMIQTSIQSRNDYFTNQHIYITSEEEIKEGDWVYYENGDLKGIHKVVNGQRPKTMILRKIILTTDQDLIKDDVRAINDTFLEWFVKNPSCEEVKVDSWSDDLDGYWLKKYKIIIPSEEHQQETTLEEAAKNYIYKPQNNDYGDYNSFIAGAKWQQERSYSEEEVLQMLEDYDREFKLDTFAYTNPCSFTVKEWFEKFKNK